VPEYFTNRTLHVTLKNYTFLEHGYGNPTLGRHLRTHALLFSALAQGAKVSESTWEAIRVLVSELEKPGENTLSELFDRVQRERLSRGGSLLEQEDTSPLTEAVYSPSISSFTKARAAGHTAQELMSALAGECVNEIPTLIKVYPESTDLYFSKLNETPWSQLDGRAKEDALVALASFARESENTDLILTRVLHTFAEKCADWSAYLRANIVVQLRENVHEIPVPLLRDTR
jgi:hypothetical protein